MAIGINQTDSLGDAANITLARARSVREQEGVMPQLVDKALLAENTGTAYRELAFSRMADAAAVAEGDEFDAPQLVTDALITGTPVEVGFEMILTDRMKRRLATKSLGELGSLAGHSMQRKKAKDGITQLDSFSTSLGNTGVTFASGYIDAAVATITGNATERGVTPIYTVIHSYQNRALRAHLIRGGGAAALPGGARARALPRGSN